MKLFHLYREADESGVSGTGIVAEGVQFTNGRCLLTWLTQTTSWGLYDSIEDLERLHGHNGKTRIVFEPEARKESERLAANAPHDLGNPR